MWIEHLEIQGFGRLAGKFAFGPAFNVLYGPNESGKSTLHEALMRALYGFDASERRSNSSRPKPRGAFAPWRGSQFGLVAFLALTNGRRYRAEWQFDPQTVRLIDAATGDAETGLLGKNEDVFLGRHLLGLELGDFREACCLDQVALGAVERSDGLTAALQRAVETGAEGLGVKGAMKILNSFVGESLGLRADHRMNPKTGGRLARLQARCTELEKQLTETREKRDEVAVLAVQLAGVGERREELGNTIRHDEQLLLVSVAAELERRLSEAQTHVGEKEAYDGHPLARLKADAKAALDLVPQLEALEIEIETCRPASNAARPGVAEVEQDVRAKEAAVAALARFASVDTEQEPTVRNLDGALVTAGALAPAAPRPAPPTPDPQLEEFRRRRSELVELASAHRRKPNVRALLVAAAVAAGSIVTALAVSPLALLGLLVAATLAVVAVRRSDGTSGKLVQELATLGGSSVEELDLKVRAEDDSVASAKGALAMYETNVAQAEQERARIEEELAAALDAAGQPAGPLDARVRAYLHSCEQREVLTTATLVLARAREALVRAKKPLEELETRERRYEHLVERLTEEYRCLGIAADDLSAAREELNHRLGAAEKASQAETALSAALAGEPLAELDRRSKDAAQRRDEHVTLHGKLVDEPADPAQVRSELQALQSRVADDQQEATRLATTIEGLERDLPEPAELERELAEVFDETHRVERARDAIRITRDAMEKAGKETHRRFAPRLNEALAAALPRITNGRYRETAIDEDLEVKLVAPETGTLVSASSLSRGTQDQIYLIERIAIAEMLASAAAEAAPMFLDDPFAHTDPDRMRLGIELLAEIAGTRQVVLISEDPRVVEFAQIAAPDLKIIELDPPQ